MIYSKKKDPFTGQEFIPTRHNQKFANRKNQIAFNNAKARRIRIEKAPQECQDTVSLRWLEKVEIDCGVQSINHHGVKRDE